MENQLNTVYCFPMINKTLITLFNHSLVICINKNQCKIKIPKEIPSLLILWCNKMIIFEIDYSPSCSVSRIPISSHMSNQFVSICSFIKVIE